jgi:hypothetical protein
LILTAKRILGIFVSMNKKPTLETLYRHRVWGVVSKMPGLSNWPDRGQDWDIEKSEVARWLMCRPEMLKWAWEIGYGRGPEDNEQEEERD